MAAELNPPSAVRSAEQPLQTFIHGVGAVGKSLEGVGVWTVLFTLLVLSITYDQCINIVLHVGIPVTTRWLIESHSEVHLEQRIDRWPHVQDPLHGPLHGVGEPEVLQVPCEVDEWPSELCLSISQVRAMLSGSIRELVVLTSLGSLLSHRREIWRERFSCLRGMLARVL
jgi:hypothetical protein